MVCSVYYCIVLAVVSYNHILLKLLHGIWTCSDKISSLLIFITQHVEEFHLQTLGYKMK